jgi:hypothetical protein
MRRRSAIVEHPFGTLKMPRRLSALSPSRLQFNKVRGEWSLMALCYNFTRVLNILGFEGFRAYMAAKILFLRKYAFAVAAQFVVARAFRTHLAFRLSFRPFELSLVSQIKDSCPVSTGKVPHEPYRSAQLTPG